MKTVVQKILFALILMLLSTQAAFSSSMFDSEALNDLGFGEKKALAQIMLDINRLPASEQSTLCRSVLNNTPITDKSLGESSIAQNILTNIDSFSNKTRTAFILVASKHCIQKNQGKSREDQGKKKSSFKARMNGSEFEHLTDGEKMKIGQLMRKIKELPTEARQSLCNGSLAHYIQSGNYSGDSKDLSAFFLTVEGISTQALTTVEGMLSADTQRCKQISGDHGKMRGENKEKGFLDKISSAWKRLTSGNDKKGRK